MCVRVSDADLAAGRRVIARLETFAEFTDEQRRLTRLFLSEAHRRADLTKAVETIGVPPRLLPSGAGHDKMITGQGLSRRHAVRGQRPRLQRLLRWNRNLLKGLDMANAAIESALNRPVWSALITGDRRFAEGGSLALRFPPDIAPFAATAENSLEAFAALRELLAKDGRVALVTLDMLKRYRGLEVVREAPIIQMVADGETPAPPEGRAPTVLGPSDVPEMLRLTQQTNPGPFGPRTHELGQYIGIRVDGALAAMAGERMRLDGAVEISAVCVSPEHRGKGYAAFLVAWLVCKLRAEGAAPFLHVFTDNPAIALYERLGFRTRKTLRLTVLARASDAAR
jgi:ribosomal protein S18 acetylase RimI-like enzyme